MRLIIEARLAEGDSATAEEGDGVLAVVERPDRSERGSNVGKVERRHRVSDGARKIDLFHVATSFANRISAVRICARAG
jgi:hypothetical protein